jgi:hypothetical protein
VPDTALSPFRRHTLFGADPGFREQPFAKAGHGESWIFSHRLPVIRSAAGTNKQITRTLSKLRLVGKVCPLDSVSCLNKNQRDGDQCQQSPSDTEHSYQPEVELDIGAARHCALKAPLTVRANRDQSDSQAGIADT